MQDAKAFISNVEQDNNLRAKCTFRTEKDGKWTELTDITGDTYTPAEAGVLIKAEYSYPGWKPFHILCA